MKRLLAPLMLLSLLVLAACSDTAPEVTAPEAAGFRFDINPSSQQVSVTAVGMEGLQTQQAGQPRLLQPDTELTATVYNVGFGYGPEHTGNVVFLLVGFRNVTDNESFSQPFTFRPAQTPKQGNYLRSEEPEIDDYLDDTLGSDDVLSPKEVTRALDFAIYHKGKPFSYFVNAYAVVSQIEGEGACGDSGVLEGEVIIRTQEDLNALRGCREIGFVHVVTDAATLDFSPLDDLQMSRDGIWIESDTLTSVSGFNSLTSAGFLRFDSSGRYNVNPSLTSISGFEKLKRGEVSIANAPSLTSIPEFNQLESGDFSLSNTGLTAFSGFNKFQNGGIFIGDNDALTSIPDFNQLTGIPAPGAFTANRLYIGSNESLTSISGFNQLSEVFRFNISDNAVLTSIPEFGQLSRVNATLSIGENPLLTTISGFGKLESVGETGTSPEVLNGLYIYDNPSLVSISGFGQLSRPGRIFTISGNASLTSISGFAPVDMGPNVYNNAVGNTFISDNPAFNCSIAPQNGLPFLPVDESTGNLVNCPTR